MKINKAKDSCFYNMLSHCSDVLKDEEIIQILLSSAMSQKAARDVTACLMMKYGSLANVISTDQHELMRVDGLNSYGVVQLKLARCVAMRLLEGELRHRNILDSWERLIDYLTADLSREHVENVRGLFLDVNYGLISSERLMIGAARHAPIQPRSIVKRALDLHATFLIIAHNHPSGNPTASTDDIRTTVALQHSLALFDITLVDHIIIGNGVHMSFRKEDWLN